MVALVENYKKQPPFGVQTRADASDCAVALVLVKSSFSFSLNLDIESIGNLSGIRPFLWFKYDTARY